MIERLIENWLTRSGERGYEVPFAQLLTSEGHRVIQGPVHHPFEHGKDILTFAPNGQLHAYQLKGPDLVSLRDFERIQQQNCWHWQGRRSHIRLSLHLDVPIDFLGLLRPRSPMLC